MKMKHALAGLAACVALMAAACAGSAQRYSAGSYEGRGQGYGGAIRISVTVSETAIVGIELLEMNETPYLGDAAIDTLIGRMVAANTAEVDMVSGATRSSTGFIAAVKDALSQAGFVGGAAAKGKLARNVPAKAYDVVVIGGGGAGLSAANAAAAKGAKVAVFEKMGVLGGNTVRATGGMNAAGTEFQAARGIADSAETFYQDTMKGGYNLNDPALVRVLAERGAESVAWVAGMGGDLSDVGRMAGSSVNRTHRPSGGAKVGPELVKTLGNAAQAKPGLSVFTEAEVLSIRRDRKGAVDGVTVRVAGKEYRVAAKAVVLATGGFGANDELAASYAPGLAGFATTNQPGATGDGIRLARALGAALVDMDQIQTHPTYAPDGGEMVTEAVRGNGAIIVNKAGRRIGNELATRDVMSADILAQEGKVAYLVFDTSIRKSLAAIESYVKAGFVMEAATPEALAALIGGEPAVLAATVERYNGFVAAKKDDEFGRADLPRALVQAPYYAIKVTPAIHHTMGGVKIDVSARVMGEDGAAIPGLFAAGEVTGGVHGGNRLGGNALSDIVTFGRIAGENAAALAKN